jgi:serine/threonine protein kinase
MGNGYSKAADLFSFVSYLIIQASLLYDMLTGKPPFYCSNKNTMMKNLISKPVPLPSYLSDNAKSLFHQLFAINVIFCLFQP